MCPTLSTVGASAQREAPRIPPQGPLTEEQEQERS
nr:MAG TPA: hypothetical protein [Caudoviricetes sp.]